jgi:hypothetical protein
MGRDWPRLAEASHLPSPAGDGPAPMTRRGSEFHRLHVAGQCEWQMQWQKTRVPVSSTESMARAGGQWEGGLSEASCLCLLRTLPPSFPERFPRC